MKLSESINIVFPHQLFKNTDAFSKYRIIVLIEDPLYFSQFGFHKKKLMLHRASMKFYESWLNDKGYEVEYLEYKSITSLKEWVQELDDQVKEIQYLETTDNFLDKQLKEGAEQKDISLVKHKSNLFRFSLEDFDEAVDNAGKKKYFLTHNYTYLRKKYDIMLDGSGEPLGGKWTFDTENRKKIPKNESIPEIKSIPINSFVEEATDYVENEFPDNPGNCEGFNYPVTFQDANTVFENFLEERFKKYGDYQDAITTRKPFLFHSLISAPLNIGLLSIEEVINKSISYGLDNEVPMNSLEGFVRQVTGWREFFRGIYEREGSYIRNQNFFNHQRSIPDSFYRGETGIVPLDDMIKKVNVYAYAHHIERLMIAGNFMLLSEIHPDQVYRWFMELFIDAYDWVMVPNVYSMSQYSDGGLLTTKPYISGSNYIRKMSHYKKDDWAEIWDALYWRFIAVNQDKLKSNPRMRMVYNLLNKMDKEKLNGHLNTAEEYLEKLN